MTVSTETEDTVFAPATSQTICPCGTRHDEFVLPLGRFQFCPAENYLYVLEETLPECELEHDVTCDELHLREHSHSLKTDLSCGFTQVVECDATYTGGAWKRVTKRA